MARTQLAELLSQQIIRLEQLITLSLRKKEALIIDNYSGMIDLAAAEERLSREYQKTDHACASLAPFFFQANPDHSSASFQEVRMQLLKVRELACELQANQKLNLALLQNSVELVRFTLNLITAVDGDKSSVYGAAGRINGQASQRHLLDYKG